jgi:hypothetical protein
LAAVIVALGLAALGCSSDDGESLREPKGGVTLDREAAEIRNGPTPHPAPGAEGDELAGLAVTTSTARVLTSTGDEDRSVLLIDLGTGRAVTVAADDGPLDPAVLTPQGAAVATGPRAITLVDGDGRPVATAAVPPDVPGVIFTLARADDAIVVDVAPAPDANGQRPHQPRAVLAYDFGASLRCVWPGYASGSSTAGQLWTDDLRTRLDVRTCRSAPGLRPLGQGTGHPALSGAGTYGVVGDDRIGRFTTRDGRLAERSADLGDFISDVTSSHGLWVLVDDRLLRLDEDSLKVRDRIHRFSCPEGGQVLAGGGRVYVVSCSHTLYEFDARTGSLVDGWALPHDRFSDLEPRGTMTAEGIWIVDVEQRGEPYLFNTRRRRFERMPLDDGLRSRIYALTFDVLG